MSVPSPYAQRKPPTAAEMAQASASSAEDCRDYLRTGRCKYGNSCKYNHPANVQTGGGMKMPLDPSEPMFPVRPNEPICQYYMKHGTCKFGQTCKFNHPPQSQLSSAAQLNGNLMLNGTGGRKTESPPMMWSSNVAAVGGDSSSPQHMLPQRPDEPNCIFYLKNGRCKYGATCRYHHPLNFHERTRSGPGDERRQQQQQQQHHHVSAQHQQGSHSDMPKIHYVTQLPSSYQQGHFVVTDGTLTFLSVDGTAQVIPVSQGSSDGGVIYAPNNNNNNGNRPLGHSRDMVASNSTPSIASSYDTAMSNMDLMGPHGGGDSSSSSLWNRPRRNSSSNSLGAYNMPDGNSRQHVIQAGRTVYVQNAGAGGDSSINNNMPLPRVGSISSNASESGSVYFDVPQGPGRSGSATHLAGSAATTWRGRRSNSFEYSMPPSSSYHAGRDDDLYDGSGGAGHSYRSQHENQQRSPMMRGRPPSQGGGRRRHPPGGAEDDDGLSMMTSALLTMLDTPEEAAGEHYDGYYDEQSMPSSQMSTPQMRPVEYHTKGSVHSPDTPGDARLYHPSQYPSSAAGYYDHPIVADDDRVLGLVRPDSRNLSSHAHHHHYQSANNGFQKHPQGSSSDDDFLRWQAGSSHVGRPLQENAQTLSVVQPPPSPNSPHAASNVGLYLP